jgi:3-phenylpropionate/trans-cinnamate dioxygenase ferredoxin subunit
MYANAEETEMSDFVSVLKTGDLAPGEMKPVDLDGTKILVGNVGGEFCAFGAMCPHAGAPLSYGYLRDDILICPLHFTQFNVRTGAVVFGVTDQPIPVYEVSVADGEVRVRKP